MTDEREKTTHFRDELAEIKGKVEKLKASADKLRNKHLADTIKAGMGRIEMALAHPDIELLSDDAIREGAEKSKAQRDAEIEAANRDEIDKGKSFPFDAQAGVGDMNAPKPASVL